MSSALQSSHHRNSSLGLQRSRELKRDPLETNRQKGYTGNTLASPLHAHTSVAARFLQQLFFGCAGHRARVADDEAAMAT